MTTIEFNKHILSYSENLRSYALSLTANQDDAKDLYQETYLKALLNREKVEDHSNLKAWVYTIMRNIFINNYRRSYKSSVRIDNAESPYEMESASKDMAIPGDSEFSYNEIKRVINNLQTEYRNPFQMYVDGYKYKEIADEQDILLGTVKSRIFNARQQLMEQLKDYVN